MAKKVIAFDLDGTLADSKSPVTKPMLELLSQLLDNYQICIISGGKFEQFEKQLLNNFKVDTYKLKRLHIMPTCGTRYYAFDAEKAKWQQVYAENFTSAEKEKILKVLNEGIDKFGFREKKTYGESIEDRGSQITFSALGQDIVEILGPEGVRLKEEWDPDVSKKTKLRNYVAKLLPEFEVRIGGGTSVDITKPGIDKAYGMRKLMKMLGISKKDVLFLGDRLVEGGNDYPVKAMGVKSIEVAHWQEAALAIDIILAISSSN